LEISLGLVLADASYWSGNECDNLVNYSLGECVMHTLAHTLVSSLLMVAWRVWRFAIAEKATM
jgi:hypothetical protein